MTTTLAELKNDFLFELSRSSELQIPNELQEFLIRKEFPWAALGKALTQFVTSAIEKVPLHARRQGTIHPQAVLEGEDIVICPGATVEAGAYIAGPTWIGPGASVRHGAYVRGSVYACANSVIGHTTEAKGTILLPKAKAAHFAYVGDSILGHDINLGAGTKLANLRLDHGEVKIRVKNEKIATGLKKFGAILGNRAQTGCNTVTNPGSIFLPGATVGPVKSVLGIVRPMKEEV